MNSIIQLELNDRFVAIEEGELISFKVTDHEFMHQKGSPGWSSSDTEMFPIIGPVDEAGFKVQTPKGIAVQDQHGHLRQMEYDLIFSNSTKAIYRKKYVAGTAIKNLKYPKKSSVEWLDWPYGFEFEKSFELTDSGLEIEFSISGDKGMPFMLGYHPNFKIHTENPIIHAGKRQITLDEVLAVGSRALEVSNCDMVTLKDKKEITIKTEGFGHFMCWTEVENMVCIEPISFYPYAVSQENLNNGFQTLKDSARFKVFFKTKS